MTDLEKQQIDDAVKHSSTNERYVCTLNRSQYWVSRAVTRAEEWQHYLRSTYRLKSVIRQIITRQQAFIGLKILWPEMEA